MIWSIGDLHFDHTKSKSMDVFGENWINHEEKIIESWKNNVSPEDLVLIPGDISWALKLEDSIEDLKKIDNLPGTKCFIKGNHDYWWGTKTKLEALGFKSIRYIYNDHVEFGNYIISGTRGWYSRDSEIFTEDDEKIFNRELNRLKLSLDSFKEDMKGKKRIVMIHYPPFNCARNPNEFLDLMIEYNVDTCVYGHLHGEGHNFAIEGNFSGVKLLCVSSDYLGFKLKSI
ncbi:MAG: serine/threonine protein phosphatase [Tissierellia bacterium]|jgi:predicted phosphohydrolase|nr:serine/threonine protein phosphatase [Tissierellia bacterium]